MYDKKPSKWSLLLFLPWPAAQTWACSPLSANERTSMAKTYKICKKKKKENEKLQSMQGTQWGQKVSAWTANIYLNKNQVKK